MAGMRVELFTPGSLVGDQSVQFLTPIIDVREFTQGSAQLEVFGMQGSAGPPATVLTVNIQYSDDGISWTAPGVPAYFTPVNYAGPGPTTSSELVWLSFIPAFIRLHILIDQPAPGNVGATFRVSANFKTG